MLRFFAIVCLIDVTASRVSCAVEFSEILKYPNRFDGRQVSLTGVADIDADEFVLYLNADAALQTDLNNAVFVRQHINKLTSERFRGHWVAVNGTIDAHRHGPRGVGFRCELVLKDVKAVDGKLVRLPTAVVGRFRNDSGTDVHVRLHEKGKGLYAEFDIPSGSFNRTAIRAGYAIITTTSGSLISKVPLRVNIAPRLTESGKKPMVYFRISHSGIESIPPEIGETWPEHQ